MSTPILTTKLYIPALRPNVVLRPRLIERLNAGLHRKLTLIAAPAGFGKTTLVSSWIYDLRFTIYDLVSNPIDKDKIENPKSKIQNRVAWLALDEGDSDLARFLVYLVAALQTIAPTIGAGLVAVLQSSQPPPTEAILTALLNDITAIPDPFVLVLDDYHLLDAKPVDIALTFLLEHLPPQMHVVIATREDPQLPLARLRARGQLTELRVADLRFTPAETAGFLTQAMGLSLSAADIATLEDRTEGWIAGLQLAALSMQGHQDVPAFIRAFAGDHQYIVDYLVEEVLQRQPEHVRSFLLQTAMLDRLSGPLCDAVLGRAPDERPKTNDQSSPSFVLRPSSFVLEELERANLFVVPLDDTRHWFRYHHLFADVLSAHLMAEQPTQVSTLHRRASAWYAENGLPADAIRHALAAKDFARAADLVELAVPTMRRSRQEVTLLGWLKALPAEQVRIRPVLSAAYAWALLTSGQLDGVEARLRDAEQWLETTVDMRERPPARAAEMVVVDEEQFRILAGSIAVYRAGQALAMGDLPGTVKYAQRVLDLLPAEEHLWRGAAAALLGLADWANGDLDAAHRMYADGMASVQKAGNISDTIGCAIALAEIRIAQGRLHEAANTYARALQLATDQGAPVLRGTADLYVGMSELHREHNDLHAATQHLLSSQKLGDFTGLPRNRYRWCVAMARIRETHGDLDGALDLLHDAERLYVSDFFPNVRPVAALKTRVWVAQGRVGAAPGWAHEQGLSAQDDLSYLREFEHITLDRVLVARYKSDPANHSIDEAIGLLERLLKAAEAGERMGSVIEILVLQALVHQMQGDLPAAFIPLQQALRRAEPEGYVRLFVDEGPPMAELLRAAQRRGIATAYVAQLLEAFPAQDTETRRHGESEKRSPDSKPSSLSPDLPVSVSLVEPLSERERDVLRLLRTDLNGPEIAHELMVSLNTMRTHTKNIYTKLDVNNRRAAVRRAEELDLF